MIVRGWGTPHGGVKDYAFLKSEELSEMKYAENFTKSNAGSKMGNLLINSRVKCSL